MPPPTEQGWAGLPGALAPAPPKPHSAGAGQRALPALAVGGAERSGRLPVRVLWGVGSHAAASSRGALSRVVDGVRLCNF